MTRDLVLIVGATSSMARHAALAFAQAGHPVALAARDTTELERIAADIRIRTGQTVSTHLFDADQPETITTLAHQMVSQPLAGVLWAVGDLGQPDHDHVNPDSALTVLDRNLNSAVALLTPLAEHLAAQKQGFIIGIGSVAGDRGRQKNYVYGAAKAGLHAYLQGLRGRLHPHGVRVITIKPGFIDTAMTYGMPGLFMLATPEATGQVIARSPEGKRDIIYTPGPWALIMLIIRHIPERIFKKLSF